MTNFLYPTLLGLLPIVGVPVLIHLINMMRHRRIRWAAMEFLLESQKKNRTWVLLKQLLLLVTRMAVIGMIVLMLAEPVLHGEFGSAFGRQKTHHIVLLDDSFSMSDRWADTSAFEEAKAVVDRIGSEAAQRAAAEGWSQPQAFTLLRFSQATGEEAESGRRRAENGEKAKGEIARRGDRERSESQSPSFPLSPSSALFSPSTGAPTLRGSRPPSTVGSPPSAPRPDLLEESVDADFVSRLRALLEPLESSQTSSGPTGALEAVKQLLAGGDAENRIVYLVSDFRARQWHKPGELVQRLAGLERKGAKLHLINCVDSARPNLAITDLAPGPGTRAAGVPLFMEVTVRNFGTAPVTQVPVLLETDGRPQPAVTIAEIPPQEAVRERFPVNFPTAGYHRITARLETDAVAADNRRYCVVTVPIDVPVLLIDGDPEASDARYLAAALAPGGPAPSGINPQIEKPRYLSLTPLDRFRAIYLLNVDRLDRSAIQALEEYVSGGGGVAFFLGERSQSKFINDELYRGGRGLFPLPLAGQAELLVDRLAIAPDLEVGGHPIFAILRGERNSFISTVIVHRYFATEKGWEPSPAYPPGSGTETIAWLRNKAPLAVERRFGDGRVVAVLTTAAPVWNNWARSNPSFVVVMLELQAYLSGRPADDATLLVGSPLVVELDPAQYQPQVSFFAPDEASGGRRAGEPATPGPPASSFQPEASAVGTPLLTRNGVLVASLPDTDTSGIYEARLTAKNQSTEVRQWAVNVDPSEGDLAVVEGPELARRLKGVAYDYQQAAVFHSAGNSWGGYNLRDALLYLLILLLIGEQILAWSASYHPRSRDGETPRFQVSKSPYTHVAESPRPQIPESLGSQSPAGETHGGAP